MDEIYLPKLHWFAMNNLFTGSCGAFRFRAKPNVQMATAKEVDFETSCITCEYWHGPYCYEKSEMEGKQQFSMTQQGVDAMKAWLTEHI